MASVEHQIRVQLKILRPKENDVVICEYPPGDEQALQEIRRVAVEAKDQLPEGVLFILLPTPYSMQAVDSVLMKGVNDLKRQFQVTMREIKAIAEDYDSDYAGAALDKISKLCG